MINFDEEIKKFKPATEIDQLEQNIYQNDFNDVADVLVEVIRQTQGNEQMQ